MIKKLLGWFVLLAVLVWLIESAYEARDTLARLLASIQIGIAFASLLVLFIVLLLESAMWRGLFAEIGYTLSFRDAFQVFFVSSLARYIPGRIWQFSSAVYLLHELGVPAEQSAAVAVISQSLTVIAGIVISVPTLLQWLGTTHQDSVVFLSIAVGLAGLILIAFFPVVWIRSVNWGLRLIGRREIPLSLPARRLGKYAVGYLLVWMGFGLAFYILVSSMTPIEPASLPQIVTGFAFAYIVGYLAVFVPGGLGVREGALVFALTFFLSQSLAISLALLARLWMTLGEVALAAIAWWLYVHRTLVDSRQERL